MINFILYFIIILTTGLITLLLICGIVWAIFIFPKLVTDTVKNLMNKSKREKRNGNWIGDKNMKNKKENPTINKIIQEERKIKKFWKYVFRLVKEKEFRYRQYKLESELYSTMEITTK